MRECVAGSFVALDACLCHLALLVLLLGRRCSRPTPSRHAGALKAGDLDRLVAPAPSPFHVDDEETGAVDRLGVIACNCILCPLDIFSLLLKLAAPQDSKC